MAEQHGPQATLDDVAAMVAESGLAMRHLSAALGDMLAIQRAMLIHERTQADKLTSIDGQLSGVNATLQAMLRELQKLNSR